MAARPRRAPPWHGCVVSGRLSRLQLSGNTQVGPEQVLIEDWCQQFPSHSIGSLAFGADGMLYVSGGDGASFNYVDYGQAGDPLNPCGDPPVAVGEAQTAPTAEGGALRSQALRGAAPPSATDYAASWRMMGPSATGASARRRAPSWTRPAGPPARRPAPSRETWPVALLNGDDGAIDFNGSTGGINIPDQNKLDLGNGPWTIELWAKLDTHRSYNTLLEQGGGGLPDHRVLRQDSFLVKAGTVVSTSPARRPHAQASGITSSGHASGTSLGRTIISTSTGLRTL